MTTCIVLMPPVPWSVNMKLYIRCEHQGQCKHARLEICMQRVNQCQMNLWVVAHINIAMMIVISYTVPIYFFPGSVSEPLHEQNTEHFCPPLQELF